MPDAPRPKEPPASPGGACGCRVWLDRDGLHLIRDKDGDEYQGLIEWCPLHAAAADLLAAFKRMLAIEWPDGEVGVGYLFREIASAAIALAEGREPVGVDPEVEDDEAHDAAHPDRGERPDEGGEGE